MAVMNLDYRNAHTLRHNVRHTVCVTLCASHCVRHTVCVTTTVKIEEENFCVFLCNSSLRRKVNLVQDDDNDDVDDNDDNDGSDGDDDGKGGDSDGDNDDRDDDGVHNLDGDGDFKLKHLQRWTDGN